MQKQNYRFFELITNPFMNYLSPQPAEEPPQSRFERDSGFSTFSSEKLSLLVFVIALIFIAVISPILCFGSLFIEINLEGLWYFWLITAIEFGYLIWLISRKIGKKAA